MAQDPNPLDLLVRKLRQHATLSDGDEQAILALPYRMRTVEAGSYVLREGDPPLQCAVLVSGFAYRQKLTGDGARQIVAIHIPGEALDFQNMFLEVADHSIQVLTRAELAFVPREAFQAIARARPGVGNAIFVTTLVDASIFREWVLNVGRRDAMTRLGHLLCEFALRLEEQGIADEYSYELPMTQEQLADAVGLTPVHVNRTLKTLEAQGLIRRSRRNVVIPDWERLRKAGDFNSRYLHLNPQDA
ncbi:MAG TPA: Crp/Fnr family transcriptional regulator [Allosphingosinicella sp.]|jgi:CRP-like cAMP-binding protein|nr:Crp/Fnr family transcriptional regulator [Allosphingosinicella sp.]